MNKNELRKKIKKEKSLLSPEQKEEMSRIIFSKISSEDLFIQSNIILLFWSMADEVQTHNFIANTFPEKRILLPSVKGDHLYLKEYTGIENMVPGEQFGIPEPTGAEFTEFDLIDLIIVPGIAFDQNNNRMGRGRGFYDKLLTSIEAYKIGIGFKFQIFDHIPVEDHDVPMDLVITN